MLNIDGVIYGNYRLNLLGKDMNRLWFRDIPFFEEKCDKSSLYINNVIDIIKKTLNNRKIYLYCDFHGHSGKQNFFLYGCSSPEKKFMEIFAKKNVLFNLPDCVNKIIPKKMNTCRALLKNVFDIDFSYCLEASMFSYLLKDDINGNKNYPFTIEKYKQIGMDFCLSLFDLINPQNDEILNNKKNTDINNKIDDNNIIYEN